jgi:hypothetical protein
MYDLSFLNIFMFFAFQMFQHPKMILPFELFDVDDLNKANFIIEGNLSVLFWYNSIQHSYHM